MIEMMAEQRRAMTSRGSWKRRRGKAGGRGLPPWWRNFSLRTSQPTSSELELPELSLDEWSSPPRLVVQQETTSGPLHSSNERSVSELEASHEPRPRVGAPGLSSASPASLSPTLRAVFRTLGTDVASLVDLTRSMEIVTTDFGPGRAASAVGPGRVSEEAERRPASAVFPNFGEEDTARGAPPGPSGQGVADVLAADGAVRVDLSLGSRSIPDLGRARGGVSLPPFHNRGTSSTGELQPADLRGQYSFSRAHRREGATPAAGGRLEDQPTDGAWVGGPTPR